MIACYILYTPAFDKYYIGATQENVYLRLQKHNKKTYGAATATAFTDDWEIFYFIECSSFKQAINIEKHIKKMKSKIYLQNLRKYPDISQKLIQKYTGT
jgi:putative endonuclease